MRTPLEPWQVAQLQRLSDTDPAQLESSLNTLWDNRPDLLEQITLAAIDQGYITPERGAQVLGLSITDVEQRLACHRRIELKKTYIVAGPKEARLADSGIPIWEVIRVHRKVGTLARLQRAFKGLSLQTLGAALTYAEENPVEIQQQITKYEDAVEQMASRAEV